MNSWQPDIEDHDVDFEAAADCTRGVVRLTLRFIDEKDPKLKASISLVLERAEALEVAEKIRIAATVLPARRIDEPERSGG